jgi:MFS transporter, ACS family, hexuronate transporter
LSYENRLVMILSAGGGVAALDTMAIYFLMPFVAKELQLNNVQIGILSIAVLIGWSISSLAVGLVSDRLGFRKHFLIATFVLFGAFSWLSALAGSFAVLFGVRVLMGLAEGPVIPISQAIMLVESSPQRRGFNIGMVQAFGGQLVGSLLGPLLMVQLALSCGWRTAFFIAGIPGLLVALAIGRYVREPNIASAGPAESSDFRLRDLFASRNVQVCTVICIAAAGWYFLIITFLPMWLVQHDGLSTREMSVVMSAVGLGGVASAVLIPCLSDEIGRVRVIALATALGAVVPLGGLILGPNVVLLALFSFTGCMMIAVFPMCSIIPLETVPRRNAATVVAITICVATLAGGGAGPLLGGFLADRYGLEATLWTALALVAVALVACAFLRETAPQRVSSGQPVHEVS